jgi:hypothetical protein
MALAWESTAPRDVKALFDRLTTLFAGLGDQIRLVRSGVDLTGAASGEFVAHSLGFKPKAVSVQKTGDASSTAHVTVGERTDTHVRLYASAACTVDVYVVF